MIKIYHNTRCSKSREACSLLSDKGIKFEIIEYLKTPPTKDELTKLIELLGISAEDLVRKNEVIYKDLYKNKTLNDQQWIEAMILYPVLIERPIIVNGKKAIIGRPAEKVFDIL